MKKALILLAAVLAMTAACHRHAPTAAAKPKPAENKETVTPPTEVGNAMPAYSATLLDGKPLDLAGEHGHVVFLNVWATWCGPCRFEIPELKKMHAKYGGRGFEVIGVSVDEGGTQQVKDFVHENDIRYPIAVDADGRIATLLQTTVLPTSLVIDRNGRIVWRQIGAIDESDQTLTNAIDKALK